MTAGWHRSVLLAMRASPAMYAVPILLGLELGVVLVEGKEWTAEWRWAVDWAGAGVFLAGPLAGGLAAWQAQSVARAPGEAAQAVGSRLRIYAFSAGGILLWAVLVHGVVVSLVVVEVWRSGVGGWANPAPIVLHWALLAACVAAGYAAGLASVSRLVPPVATLALLVLMIQASNGALPMMWVEVGGATAPLGGLRYRPEIIVGQLVLFLAPMLVAVGLTRGSGGRRGRFAWLGAGCALTVAAAWGLATAEQNRFTVVPSGDLVRECFGTSPEVCVIDDARSHGAQIHEVFAAAHSAAGRHATLPASYTQVLGTEGPSDGQRQFVLDAGVIDGGEVVASQLVRYVVWNRDCLLADEPPPARGVDLIADLEMVLLARMDPGYAADDRLLAAFQAQPPDAQDAWVAAALAASATCAFDDIPDWLSES